MSYNWETDSLNFLNNYAIGRIKLITDKLNLPTPPDSVLSNPKCWENQGSRINGITKCTDSRSNQINGGSYDPSGKYCAPDYMVGLYPPPSSSGVPSFPAAKYPCANYSLKVKGSYPSPPETICENGLLQDPLGCPANYANLFRHVKMEKNLHSTFSTVCASTRELGKTCFIGRYGTAGCISGDCRQECIDPNRICKANTTQTSCLLNPLQPYPDNINPNNCGFETNCFNENSNWALNIDVNNIKDFKKGWIICEFYYDFEKLDSISGASDFYKWVRDIYQGDGIKILPGIFSTMLIIRAYIYHTMYLFYGYMYNTKISKDFSFNNYNFFLSGFERFENDITITFSDQITNLTNKNVNDPDFFSKKLGDVINFDNLNNIISSRLFIPPIYDYESNCFIININQSQYSQIINDKNKDDLISSYMDYFLMNSKTLPKQQFQLHLLSYKINTINVSSFTISQYSPESVIPDDEFITSYTLSCSVEKWSHMLILYVEYLLDKQFINLPVNGIGTLCKNMYKDTGFYSNSCVNDKCNNVSLSVPINVNNNQCLTDLTLEACTKKITPGYQALRPGDYILDESNQYCYCLNSNLAPVSEPQYNNKTSMCFSKDCFDDNMKKTYGLTPEFCQTQCAKMSNWIRSTEPSSHIQNRGSFDEVTYYDLCTDDVINSSRYKFEWRMCIYLLILTFLLTHYVFQYLNHLKISKVYVTFVTSLVFLIMSALAIYLGFEFNGKSYCQYLKKDQYMKCKSGITGITIPLYFCKSYLPCQCAFDSDCGKNCKCLSQTCVPEKDEDYKYRNEDITQVNVFKLIVLLIISVFILRYCWIHFPKQWLVFISIFAFLITVTLFLSLEKYTKFINISSCE